MMSFGEIRIPLGRHINRSIFWYPLYDLIHLLIYQETLIQHLAVEVFMLRYLSAKAYANLQIRKLFGLEDAKIDAVTELQYWLFEMERRYDLLNQNQLENVHLLNQQLEYPLPIYLLFVPLIESKYLEDEIIKGLARLAQLSRCVGIHLVIQINELIYKEHHFFNALRAVIPGRICGHVENLIISELMIGDTLACDLHHRFRYVWDHPRESYIRYLYSSLLKRGLRS